MRLTARHFLFAIFLNKLITLNNKFYKLSNHKENVKKLFNGLVSNNCKQVLCHFKYLSVKICIVIEVKKFNS